MQMYRTGNLLQFFTKTFYATSRSSSSHNIIERLKNRALLKVSGNETADYLQGLITNDVRHIERGGCMYSMFLNTKGRVLYDTIIYKTEEVCTYLIECDIEVIASLEKHLQIYKLRRKINITSLLQNCNIYALFNPDLAHLNVKGVEVSNKNLDSTETSTKTYKDLLIYRDPRISLLGSRIISPKDTDVKTNISEICTFENNPKPEETYKWLRYTLGVGEGVKDLPPGNCFPLEANCDYLHGVSFHKGCYIGQELTARTHHTGVVRKRLMPLLFSKVPGKMPESETVVYGDVNLGKLRGIEGDAGLGLLRVAKCLDLDEINIGNGVARTLRPTWWPVEASKEKIVQRNE